jgi:predicted extracellular nuclease
MTKTFPKFVSALALLAALLAVFTMQGAQALSPDIVISQVYGGGGNSGAPFRNDYVELFNRGTTTVSLSGLSVQYASATGTGNFGANPVVSLSGNIASGQYYLVQLAGGAVGAALPAADATGTANLSGSAGKVALVSSTTGLACNGGSTPCSSAQLALIKDLVGYGNANFFESAAAPAPSNTTAIARLANGCTETDNNAADFAATAPTPRNTASSPNPCGGPPQDEAPTVTGTFPVNGATDFPVGANLSVSFSEPVNVGSSWFTLSCTTSGSVATTFSGGPKDFTLDPGIPLANGETCTLTILANQVSDQDNNDPPDNMVMNFEVGFSPLDACLAPFTAIPAIQGNGANAAITGTVTTKGVVVGDFEGTAGASGFYLQDLAGDGDPATSDGIFVFTGNSNLVSVGQVVRVSGFARERFTQTTLNGTNSNTTAVPAANIVACGTGSVLPTDVTMPFASAVDPERYEGMLVRFPQPLVIAEYFNYDRFGEIVLALPLDGESRPFTGTAIDEPGAPASARALANSLRRITLDDAQSAQNPPFVRHPNGAAFSLSNLFRGGDIVQNATGVLGFDFNLYRIFPTGPANYTAVNPRPAAPEPVGGSLRVAAMNTLNFFLTLDFPTGNPLDNKCGPAQNVECRGADADQPNEFARQRAKLLSALSGLDADIIGLNELENTTGVEPLADIVAGLPGYAFVDTGTIGGDAIRVGLIYRPAKVAPVGSFQILDSSDDPRFLDTKSRPSLAQTFQDLATGARFTVVVNHFKSKGSDCVDVNDPDQGDGQGNCSGTRTLAAQALVDWLATDPTSSGDPDFLIMGDLNSYAQENPIDAIKAGSDDALNTGDDFTNLIAYFNGPYAYSYTFDGQAGYLDHSLASASLLGQVTGASDWHINSDEADLLDYDTSFKPPAQAALFEPNGFRSSDHDPVVVGLNVVNFPPELGAIAVSANLTAVGGPAINASVPFVDPDKLDTHTAVWDWGDGATSTGTVSEANGAGTISGSHMYATPGVYRVTVTVSDPYGNTDQAIYEFVVAYDPSGGFVTGGGWIVSPPGAYAPDPSLTGKANFGFVAKYQKGANVPQGNTQFQFQAGDLSFKSTSYQWLVVAGAKAQFKGVGTINGGGSYGFMLTAIDGQVNGGGGVDKFRIKITDPSNGGVIYDNLMGGSDDANPTTALGGGNIAVHKSGGVATAEVDVTPKLYLPAINN